MCRFKEYNLLISGETIGWLNGRRVVRDLTPDEYDTLLSLLTHWKTRLRWSAADRLGKLGDDRAVGPLIDALQDPHWLVRLHAARALGRIGAADAVTPLVDAMVDECPYVRRRIVTALGMLARKHDARITRFLISALDDVDRGVCRRAVTSLWDRGFPAAAVYIDTMAGAMSDHDADVSWRAAEALERVGAPAVVVLIRLLDSPDERVRYRSVKTLGRIGDRRAVKPLRALLNDPDQRVRWRAGFALRQIAYWSPRRRFLQHAHRLKEWWQALWKRAWP